MQNYHRHTSYSNIFIADSAAVNEDYAKRAVELGHKVISSVEHGWQGYYYETFELAQKYGLKMVFGAEAYWVKDRLKEHQTGVDKNGNPRYAKDKTNCHIIILAKTEKGRRAINNMLSTANEDGYYIRPRVDLELLLSLPPEDVFITTACIAFWHYEDIDRIVEVLHDHFKDNMMLEIQYHNTEPQKALNRHIKELSEKLQIKMIVGLDSHYIYPEEAEDRQYVLDAKDIHYEDEEGWYMDYPDDETVIQRFLEQGVFTQEEIQEAMDNTDITLTFDDFFFNKEIKLPSIFDCNTDLIADCINKTKEEKNRLYETLIYNHLEDYLQSIPKEEHEKYYQGVNMEVAVYENTDMVDYPLIDYAIVKKGVENGGLITFSGRGSGVGYFTNTLCGFSKVDRFQSPIKLYPERFISESRIKETHSLPDLDMNLGTPEIFEAAQIEVMGADHAVPLIAFGTLKKKSAFKMYARAMKLDFDLANAISAQIDEYDRAVKEAEDDEKDEIDIYDFVDPKYHDYLTQSKKYWGIISDKKKAPCAYMLYGGSIREEIGLIKCKSESTGKECITAVVDGAIAENYKFLKNDLLKVDVVLLINKIYERIGIKPHTVNELTALVENDQAVWDLYGNGFTQGLNQTEKHSTTKRMMDYKASNISELTAFIAAIRPAFKTMYSKFASREPFEYGIPAFDKILQTPQFPYSYILYQEQTMNTLNYAGFPLDECYGIIKAIAKKHPEKVLPLKARFIEGFRQKIVNDEHVDEAEAQKMSEQVWQIISDSCGYGFNSAHAYCMALDSLYNAWQKAHYPYEFYEVLLQHYSDKGKKDKVALLKQEMAEAFGIQEGEYIWGADNRHFVADKHRGVIYPALNSIKSFSYDCAEALYDAASYMCCDFIEVLQTLKNYPAVNEGKIETLIKLDYFKEFGKSGKLMKISDLFSVLYGKKQFKKADIENGNIVLLKKRVESIENEDGTKKKLPPTKVLIPVDLIQKTCVKETDKMFVFENTLPLMYAIAETYEDKDLSLKVRIQTQLDYLGYITYVNPKLKSCYYVLEVNTKYSPVIKCYDLATGATELFKMTARNFAEYPIPEKSILQVLQTHQQQRKRKVGVRDDGTNIWEDVPGEFNVYIDNFKLK